MENAKKTFIAGINTDDSYFAHTVQDNLDALNLRVVSSSSGKSGSVSNVEGTRKIPNTQSFNNTKVIGSYEDPTTNDIFYFLINTSTLGCAIYCYKSKLENIYKVLSDNNLDSEYRLGFNKDKPITGIAYIDNILYWTGVEGREPFRINVERGILTNNTNYVTSESAYIQPILKSVITLIRKPPMLPLVTEVQEDSTRDTSFLKSRAHTFAYRYVYKDGETSVFSPTSHHYPNQDVDDLNHKTSKKIRVDFPRFEAEYYGVSQDVHKIQFAVKFDKDTSYFIWKEFDSETHATVFSGQTIASQGVITADFYNDVLGFSVDDANSIKLYDTVPYEAEALSIARNRLFLGNIKEGRLNPKQIDSSDISLQILSNSFSDSFSQYDRNRGGKVGFAHASAYQIGIAFYDFAGRTGGVLTDDSLKIITPERGVQLSSYNSTIKFTLNDSLRNKIPDWAEYYAIVRTKNLTKDFTISNMSDKVRYYTSDSTSSFTVNVEKKYPINDENDRKAISGTPNGTFSDAEFVSFDAEYEGCAVGLGDLTSYKQGYSYQEGDRIKLITSNAVFEAAVTGQEGGYVKTNLYNLNSSEYLNTGSLSNRDYEIVYEIYSPHKIQTNEFFYEAFNGRILRQPNQLPEFSETTGDLIGDVYLRSLAADTSYVENYFFEGNSRSSNSHDHEIDGEIKYIDFPVFYGDGNSSDMTCNTGANNGTHNLDLRYDIKISSLGTPDKFKWRKRTRTQYATNEPYSSEVSITGSSQDLDNGVAITFATTTGHIVDDRWVVNAKIADNSGMNEEHRRYTATFASPPNGTILVNSEIKLYLSEYKGGTMIASEDRKTWEVTYPAASVTRTYESIEELFWESSFGTAVLSAAQGDMDNFSFRRGTIDPSGNGGLTQLNILNYLGSGDNQEVSQSDGSTIHMIYEGVLRFNNGGREVKGKHTINIDFGDSFPYATESMNPSSDYFLNWTQITGKPNLVPSEVSSQIKTTGIVFSETKIPGSKINGLSKFSALDEKRLDDATGPLRSLKITSKTQSTGSIMLAISENETSGIYLGEQQLQQASSGGQFLAVSSSVIGTINTLQGSYGTKHPESIVVNEGKAYWFDIKNSTVIKYDNNALTAIGDVKMKTFFKEKSDIIVSDSLTAFIVGTYDDYNSEYILTLPKTGETTVVLQEDPYYPEDPIIDITNEGEEPTSMVVNVSILKPWSLIGEMTVIDGVGTFTFTSPYAFSIPTNVVISPSGSTITVENASSGGFSTNSNGDFSAGTASLTISNVFGDVDLIELQLSREIQLSTGTITVSNVTEYHNDTEYLYANILSGLTPFRITGATASTSLDFEEKDITLVGGTLTIPGSSYLPWQLGNTNANIANLTECTLGVCSSIAPNRISTTATAIDAIGYKEGSFNIVITGVTEDVDSIVLDSRPLKVPVIGSILTDGITASGMTLNSSITLNRATAIEYGFVYSTTNTSPIIGGTGVTKVILTDVITDLDHSITGLSASTGVFAKTYLISNFGTKYGSRNTTFTGSESNTAPTVFSNQLASDYSGFSGIITANGGSTAGTNGITQRGVVYSITDTTPTLGESGVITITTPQEPISGFPYLYSSYPKIQTLAEGATYYWRAYAQNDVGTGYGTIQNFTVASASNVGIEGFSLNMSYVDGDGGEVSIDVFKSAVAESVTGSISITFSTGSMLIESESVTVSFTANQYTDTIQVSVPANTQNQQRNIDFRVSQFSGISNNTGMLEPILISGYVTQPSTSFNQNQF